VKKKPTRDVTDVSNEATEISNGRLMISGAGIGGDVVFGGSASCECAASYEEGATFDKSKATKETRNTHPKRER